MIIENSSATRAVSNRAEAYVRCFVEKLCAEMNSLNEMLPIGRAVFEIVSLRSLIQKQVLWINQQICPENVKSARDGRGHC